jgi:hypothetical protein
VCLMCCFELGLKQGDGLFELEVFAHELVQSFSQRGLLLVRERELAVAVLEDRTALR